jgi:hypothetical protein
MIVNPRILCVLAAAAFLTALSVTATAQTAPPIDEKLARPPGLEPVPDGPPELPKGGITDLPNNPEVKFGQPDITIRDDGENKIEEFRVNGKLYAIRVTPKIGPPYTMIDKDGTGHFEPSDPAGETVHPPRWTLFEF